MKQRNGKSTKKKASKRVRTGPRARGGFYRPDPAEAVDAPAALPPSSGTALLEASLRRERRRARKQEQLRRGGCGLLPAIRFRSGEAVGRIYQLENDAVAVVTAALGVGALGGNGAIAARGNPAQLALDVYREETSVLERLVRDLEVAGDPLAARFAGLEPILRRRVVGLEAIAKQRQGLGTLNSVKFLVELGEGSLREIAVELAARAEVVTKEEVPPAEVREELRKPNAGLLVAAVLAGGMAR